MRRLAMVARVRWLSLRVRAAIAFATWLGVACEIETTTAEGTRRFVAVER